MFALQVALDCLNHPKFRYPDHGRLVQHMNFSSDSPTEGVVYFQVLGGVRYIEVHFVLNELPGTIDPRMMDLGVQPNRGRLIGAEAELKLPSGETWRFRAITTNNRRLSVELIEAPAYNKPPWRRPFLRMQRRISNLTGHFE